MKKILIALLVASGCASHHKDHLALDYSTSDLISYAHSQELTEADLDRLYRFYPKTLERVQKYRSLTAQDIINLTRSGVSDSAITFQIVKTNSHFFLSPEDEAHLKQAGVSDQIIETMKETVNDSY